MLFEYWKTDHAGHSMDREEALNVLGTFDRFLTGILEVIDPERQLLVITSDHGNIEDISIKVHTRNPVPLILHGKAHATVAEFVQSNPNPDLTAVTPALLMHLTGS
jgi:2,3-bisphosphoglycerate-independent phosphoglycerate mutase